ncbi:unnamed protein product, partial [Polarella glacialis]
MASKRPKIPKKERARGTPSEQSWVFAETDLDQRMISGGSSSSDSVGAASFSSSFHQGPSSFAQQAAQGNEFWLPPIPKNCALARVAAGVGVGDARFDAMDLQQLSILAGRIDGSTADVLAEEPLPSWADPNQVRRGQAVFRRNFSAFMHSFEVALLWGCRVHRFASVLAKSGYCQSPLVAYRRFRDTARHVYFWCIEPDLCSDAHCRGRKSVDRVRAMHALARRHVSGLGVCKVGVP